MIRNTRIAMATLCAATAVVADITDQLVDHGGRPA